MFVYISFIELYNHRTRLIIVGKGCRIPFVNSQLGYTVTPVHFCTSQTIVHSRPGPTWTPCPSVHHRQLSTPGLDPPGHRALLYITDNCPLPAWTHLDTVPFCTSQTIVHSRPGPTWTPCPSVHHRQLSTPGLDPPGHRALLYITDNCPLPAWTHLDTVPFCTSQTIVHSRPGPTWTPCPSVHHRQLSTPGLDPPGHRALLYITDNCPLPAWTHLDTVPFCTSQTIVHSRPGPTWTPCPSVHHRQLSTPGLDPPGHRALLYITNNCPLPAWTHLDTVPFCTSQTIVHSRPGPTWTPVPFCTPQTVVHSQPGPTWTPVSFCTSHTVAHS